MEYTSNVNSIFRMRKVGKAQVCYRLFHSVSDNGGYFLLMSSKRKDSIADVFLPFIAESEARAKEIFFYMYNGGVTPCAALEVLDDFLGNY